MKTNQQRLQCGVFAAKTALALAAIVLLGCSHNGAAQTNTSPWPSSGNVGIGTTSPTQSLDVSGRIVTTGNQTLTELGSAILEIKTTVTNNGINTPGIRMRNIFNGTTATQEALDVAPTFAPPSSIFKARGFISAAFFAPPSGVIITHAWGGNAVNVYGSNIISGPYGSVTEGTAFAINPPINFGLNPTTQYGLRINNQGIPGGTANSYGLYVDAQSGSTNNYAAIFEGGNVGIGTTTPGAMLDVNGSINVSGNINAKFQDVAEWVPSSEQLRYGTVVVLDSTKSNQVMASTTSYDTRVAGVVSEHPGIALGEKGESKVLVATTGRVRVKVDATRAPIHIGDLLVTSDVSGVAMKSEPVEIGGVQLHRPGTLIGKALEPLEKGSGTILVLLSLQ